MAEDSFNKTLELANATSPIVLTKLQNATNELTYFLFDNQLIHGTIGQTLLSNVILMLISVISITIGSYGSIIKPNNAKFPNKEHPLFDPSDKDVNIEEDSNDQIPKEIFYTLPIFAGFMLYGLYFCSKNYDIETISNYLNKLFIIQIFSSISTLLIYGYDSISRNLCYLYKIDFKKINKRFTLTISEDVDIHASGIEKEMLLPDITEREKIIKEEKLLEIRKDINKKNQIFNFYFKNSSIYGYSFGFIFTILYSYYKGHENWILNNLIGISIVSSHLMQLKVPNFKIGIILLTCFFFYDIYFVFGTDIMVTVATKINTPSKLLIPNKVSKIENEIRMTLLGLGDLALPGCFIALCLRFDLFIYHLKNKNTEFHLLNKFPKNYFATSIISYIIGLIITFRVHHIFKVGQPALLYLCPSLLISVITVAICRGELSYLWNYDESIESTDEKDKEFDIICSKETLFLSGEIAEEDIDDPEDEDYEEEGDEYDEEELEEEKDM
jgi:minor histocompatibility antigen H13